MAGQSIIIFPKRPTSIVTVLYVMKPKIGRLFSFTLNFLLEI